MRKGQNSGMSQDTRLPNFLNTLLQTKKVSVVMSFSAKWAGINESTIDFLSFFLAFSELLAKSSAAQS
jgi:hypothetical protein